uniref:HTH OST-type domain-containing protein n=1 Tax=Heterorhabditis bacteriophora TaxID=37862 RepID=A0A1I7XSR6_HETBA
MENSLKEEAANPDAMEKQLRLLRIELFSLAVAFPDPASAYKFQMEHLENFGYEADVRKFGYPSMDEFLSDHPRLDTVFIDDRKCYRAKFEEKTADIQNMVAKQKKKKRIKKNFRSNFDRTVTIIRAIFMTYFQMKPFEYARTSLRVTATASPVVPMHLIGIQRFMLALKSCNGTATLTRLNKAYLHLYKVQFDKCELIKHFDWSIAHNQVVKPEKVHCEIPSLAKLYLNVVAMLEDMHPFTIQSVRLSDAYLTLHEITSKIPAVSRVSPKKVTAVDLGLEISSSDFDEDDDSYYGK